jgi:hypothetical protein
MGHQMHQVRSTALGVLDKLDTQEVGDGNPPGLDREALRHRAGTTPTMTGVRRSPGLDGAFDPRDFLEQNGTLYLLATARVAAGRGAGG